MMPRETSIGSSMRHPEASGGWIASVVDLARFMAALFIHSGFALLNQETLRKMTSATPSTQTNPIPPKSGGYALRWYLEKDERGRTIVYHTGPLPGTSAFMGRRSDGVAVLFNSDTRPQNDLLIRLLMAELAPAIDSLSAWPVHDLFPIYFPGRQYLSTSSGDAHRQGYHSIPF